MQKSHQKHQTEYVVGAGSCDLSPVNKVVRFSNNWGQMFSLKPVPP